MDAQLKKDVEMVIKREIEKSIQSAARHEQTLKRLQRQHPASWLGQTILAARIKYNQRKLAQKQKEVVTYREALAALQRGDPQKAIDVLSEIISKTLPVSVINTLDSTDNFLSETPNPAFDHLMKLWSALNEEVTRTESSAA